MAHVIRLCLPAFFLCTGYTGLAQQRLYTNQQHFGVEEGLPQSFITGITQDEDGFIWFGTLDGLCRFDGRTFKTIKFRPTDSTGLAANTINSLSLAAHNTLRVYYNSPFEADNFNMRTFKASHNTILAGIANIPNVSWAYWGRNQVPAGLQFIMNNHKGVGWIEPATGKVMYANRANGLLQQDTVNAVIQSADGRLFLVSEDGVQVSDTGRKTFTCIRFDTHVKNAATPTNIMGYLENYPAHFVTPNKLVVLTENNIVLLDINKKTSAMPYIPQSKYIDPTYNLRLQVDAQGLPYFTNHGRIFRLEKDGQAKLLWENTGNPKLHITAMFIDRSNVLWVSVDAQGLLKIDLQPSLFQFYTHKSTFIKDVLQLEGGKPLRFPKDWNPSSYYIRQVRDSKGQLYIASNWAQQNEVFLLNQQGIQALPVLTGSSGYSALVNMPGNIITAFNPKEATWYSWKNTRSLPTKIPLDDATMKDVEIADAAYIGGYTWISTYAHGLLQYSDNKRINHFNGKISNGFMPATLTEICVDQLDSSQFWIGSRGGGLILWDVKKGLQQVYSTDDGLPNNTVYCILPDKLGNIWCSTNKGIFRLNVKTRQVTSFEKSDGLSDNEFNRAHKFAFADGRLCFGGLDGYTIFNPADFDEAGKKQQVQVMLTGLQINNQPQNLDIPESIIKESLSTLTSIDLSHNNNYLRFEFAAMLFNQPQKTKYRYRLDGVDKNWVENGTNNIAAYPALPPGKYLLHINASGTNGTWSYIEKTISIHIHPPFWATWWAYCIYILIAIGLIRWYLVFRERRLKAAQELAFEKREAFRLKEVDELKDRFFSNITHEFRTPLTLIITPLEKLEQDPSLSAVAISTVRTAQRNSKQLLRLINEFLDFSKLNDGQLKLKLSAGDLELFTADCMRSFEAAAKDKNITLSFSANGIEGYYLFDEDKWGKIISNLLSNALKFTPTGGMVSVSLFSSPDNTIQLEVTDNGPGIPADQQKKIFDRFYQVDDSAIRTYGGTGIGLSLVKELTELMQGSIELDSKPGGLTVFSVSIPMKKLHPAEIVPATDPIIDKKKIVTSDEQDLPLLLIAEDNDELRSFLTETMRKHYRVLEAADGLKAQEVILQELPDIVISDVMMPGQDGFDLCRICKADNRTAHVGFILLTSKAAHDARLKGLGTGADDYITKPFNLQELELRIANLLQLQQKQRAWLQAKLISSSPPDQLPEITDPFLVALYGEMDAKLDDPQLGVDHLCKTMAMSRSTLNRKLKSLLDMSPNDLIRQYRLQTASRLISSGQDISTVAYRVGFSSPSYFSQCFKEQYGITPSAYVSRQS
ncbi:MAG TPA: ATP-binding protein [Ferruginibacter sp.]|nr:ATP-binding protein [Ferruginibacter sp.]